MQWLNKVADELITHHPEGEIIVESGVSPSGTYHVGTLREVLTADAIMLELRRRGRQARHIHFVDDLDVFRKVPTNVSPEFEKYLGRPLSDVPAPDGSAQSYADYFLSDFLIATKSLHIEMEILRSHERYRKGFMIAAIEQTLENSKQIRQILETISGHKLDENWSPIQVMEDEYLKSRQFVSINKTTKTLNYLDQNAQTQTVSYSGGQVKLNWRVDWPARWWLIGVNVEPFGRDHASRGGSYDTGVEIIRTVFKAQSPLPVPYHFINRVGETKKMSKSVGEVIAASEFTEVLPPEIVRFFVLKSAPDRQLFFDEVGVTRLIDEFSGLLAKEQKNSEDEQLLYMCRVGLSHKLTISRIPFSHLVASYQAALKDPQATLEVLGRTEYKSVLEQNQEMVKDELKYIDKWLKKWAPEEVKFELKTEIDAQEFSDTEKEFLKALSEKIAGAPTDVEGEWLHKAMYELKDSSALTQQQLFETLYRVLIGKKSGPRAGWFLSILPRDWLMKRLRLET